MKKGSLTVETALVFPLFFFSVVALIYAVAWFQTAEKVQKDMVNEARIVSAGSYIEGKKHYKQDEIYLKRNYLVHIECPVLSLVKVRVSQGVHMRKFTGVAEITGGDGSDIVYITAHGRVYHRNSACTYLKVKTEGIPYSEIEFARNLDGGKYERCLKCIGRGADGLLYGKTVYVSKYGNRYHADKLCRAISRDVMAIKLEAAGGRPACSKCGRGKGGL